jgi:hypothetical protein
MFTITEQIEDIKTAIISTISNAQSRDIARSVIKYRRLVDFLRELQFPNYSLVTQEAISFEELLSKAEIVSVRDIPGPRPTFGRAALIKYDGTFYEMRFARDYLMRIGVDWTSFAALTTDVRGIIFDAISDMGHMGPGLLRYRAEQFDEYFAEQLAKEEVKELSLKDLLSDSGSPSEGEG